MGAALARALLKTGHPELGEALRASPRTLICVADYRTTSILFDESGVAPILDGRTVIQLSTGTPREASDSDI